MDLQTLISVIIPLYNYEAYIAKCLESILKQTYKHIEAIVVDDGSTDKSGFIADEYAKIDNRIRVIHKKNGGIGSAVYEALKHVKGEYIAFLDSDDYMEIDAYENLLRVAKKEDADIVIYGVSYMNLEGQVYHLATSEPMELDSNKEIMFDYLMRDTVSPLSRKFCKKKLFDNLSMLEYSAGIDEVISIQIHSKAKRLVKIKECYYYAVAEPRKDSVGRRAIDGAYMESLIHMHESIIEYLGLYNPEFLKYYQLRFLNFMVDRATVIYRLQEDNSMVEGLIKKYRINIKSFKRSKVYSDLTMRKKMQLFIFQFFPFQYLCLSGMIYRRS